VDTKPVTGTLTRLLLKNVSITLMFWLMIVSVGAAQEDVPVEKPVQEVSKGSRQIRRLVSDLVRVRAEVEAYKKRLALREAVETQSSEKKARMEMLATRELRILDVSPELDMLVLNAGSWREVRAGMKFAVRRDGVTIAEAVVIDVREQIAGLSIESVLVEGTGPVIGDRAILFEKKE
jgi:hypothetical protein